jgi:hypothetical protein
MAPSFRSLDLVTIQDAIVINHDHHLHLSIFIIIESHSLTMEGAVSPSLQVQINQIDHILVPPGPLDNSSLYQAPVIRVFGPSSTGQKACIHIHQVYPYFFVDYLGELDPVSGQFMHLHFPVYRVSEALSQTIYSQATTFLEYSNCDIP